jgi:Ca2+-binding EF-hand superfamily protein
VIPFAFFVLALPLWADEDVPDLCFPGKDRPHRVRLELTADRAWDDFLDRLFVHFDRDGDGSLNRAEMRLMFALPLPAGKSLAFDFARMDADRDGKVSRADFKAYCRREGFGPVKVDVLPVNVEAFRLGEVLFRHLDADRDGTLTRAELERAPALLRRLDEDDDEVLTPAEILAVVPGDKLPEAPKSARVTAAREGTADTMLRLKPGETAPRLTMPGHSLRIEIVPLPGKEFEATRQFYLSLWQGAAGDKAAITQKQIEEDVALQPLADLFEPADRDGDGQLKRSELEAFLDLIERGTTCQTCITLIDRGHNLFDALDTDGDGRLDLAELRGATQLLGRDTSLRREDVPLSWRITVRRGPGAKTFGPVVLAAPPRPSGTKPVEERRGPRWFQAMDKRRRGYLTRDDFLGPPELFQRLDRDGDGRITVEEAERAGARLPE